MTDTLLRKRNSLNNEYAHQSTVSNSLLEQRNEDH